MDIASPINTRPEKYKLRHTSDSCDVNHVTGITMRTGIINRKNVSFSINI